MTQSVEKTIVLPEYVAYNLNAPFKVILKDSVRQTVNGKTGEILKTTIPNPRTLLRAIATTRLLYVQKLSGAEIKFVRKALTVKASELADMLSVTAEHLSRCESGDRVLSPGLEKCLRLSLLLSTLELPEEIEGACQGNEALMKSLADFRRAIQRLQDLIKKMEIMPVRDNEDNLCLTFIYGGKDGNVGSDDNYDESWADESQLSKAA